MRVTTCLAALATLAALPASANVMTFDSLAVGNPGIGYPSTYTEDGITATAGDLVNDGDGMLHMDDSGVPTSNASVSFTMAQVFDAISLDFHLLSFDDGAYENVRVTGYAGMTEVASIDHQTAPSETFVLTGFTGLTELRVIALSGTGLCAPCGHFKLDNVVLSPVPLPGAGLLAVAGLAGLAFAGRRRA